MLRSSEIKPLFVDLSLRDKSFSFYTNPNGGHLQVYTGTPVYTKAKIQSKVVDDHRPLHSYITVLTCRRPPVWSSTIFLIIFL